MKRKGIQLLTRWALVSFVSLFAVSIHALEFSDIAQEGEIRFLKQRPDGGAYRYQSRLQINEASLETGIVTIQTCHYQLDPIRKVVIVFNPDRIRDIQVRSIDKMAMAEVKDARVTLTDVQRGASICIDLQSRALDRVAENQYRLNAGPLMRRYFDGYLPMAATMRFDWPANLLRVVHTQPAQQDGVKVFEGIDGLQLEMIFAGKLTAQITLEKK